jgi:DnaJ-class molecular chaperone
MSYSIKMQERNYYILLEIKSTASHVEIKSAFRALAKKYHPDKNRGNKSAEDYFKEIQQAYAILSNPEKRRRYDHQYNYKANAQKQKRNYSNAVPYKGNAYQYAQQQAQASEKSHSHSEKKGPEKKDYTESWQLIVSIGIALLLVYFIISYSSEKTVVQPTNVLHSPK